MKRVFIGIVGLLFCLATVAQTNVKKDPKAKVILDKASTYYKSISSFKATFTFGIHTAAKDMNKSMKGSIIYKAEKFIIDKGDGVTVYTNGKTVWQHYEEDNEVTISDYDAEEFKDLSIQRVADQYKEGYKYILKGEATINGKLCHEIDLDPDLSPDQHKRNQVFKIRLHISKATGRIVQWKTFYKNGDRYTVTINSFTPNHKVADSAFNFQKSKYPGILIEDFRE